MESLALAGEQPIQIWREPTGVLQASKAHARADLGARPRLLPRARPRAADADAAHFWAASRAMRLLVSDDKMLAIDTFFRKARLSPRARTRRWRSCPPRSAASATPTATASDQVFAKRVPWEFKLFGYKPAPWATTRSSVMMSRLASYVNVAGANAGRLGALAGRDDPGRRRAWPPRGLVSRRTRRPRTWSWAAAGASSAKPSCPPRSSGTPPSRSPSRPTTWVIAPGKTKHGRALLARRSAPRGQRSAGGVVRVRAGAGRRVSDGRRHGRPAGDPDRPQRRRCLGRHLQLPRRRRLPGSRRYKRSASTGATRAASPRGSRSRCAARVIKPQEEARRRARALRKRAWVARRRSALARLPAGRPSGPSLDWHGRMLDPVDAGDHRRAERRGGLSLLGQLEDGVELGSPPTATARSATRSSRAPGRGAAPASPGSLCRSRAGCRRTTGRASRRRRSYRGRSIRRTVFSRPPTQNLNAYARRQAQTCTMGTLALGPDRRGAGGPQRLDGRGGARAPAGSALAPGGRLPGRSFSPRGGRPAGESRWRSGTGAARWTRTRRRCSSAFTARLFAEVFGGALGAGVAGHLVRETGMLADFYDAFDKVLLAPASPWFGARTQADIWRAAALPARRRCRRWRGATIETVMMTHLLLWRQAAPGFSASTADRSPSKAAAPPSIEGADLPKRGPRHVVRAQLPDGCGPRRARHSLGAGGQSFRSALLAVVRFSTSSAGSLVG